MSTRLDYNNGEDVLPDKAIRISASQIYRFIYKTSAWYQEQILGEITFTGNTSSVLGTCVHFCAEEYILKGNVDTKEIDKYLDTFKDNTLVDISYIKEQYPVMATNLVEHYLQKYAIQDLHSEKFLFEEIQKGSNIYVSGSCDLYHQDVVVDYKTTSALTAPTTISQPYLWQLLVYAYLLRRQGIQINRIRIVYITRDNINRKSEKTGKTLKDYPSTVTTITETIDDNDLNFIESILTLCNDTIITSQEHPELTYLLFKDYRLKSKK